MIVNGTYVCLAAWSNLHEFCAQNTMRIELNGTNVVEKWWWLFSNSKKTGDFHGIDGEVAFRSICCPYVIILVFLFFILVFFCWTYRNSIHPFMAIKKRAQNQLLVWLFGVRNLQINELYSQLKRKRQIERPRPRARDTHRTIWTWSSASSSASSSLCKLRH